MIRYRLNCDNGHEFEAWFASSAAYDNQAAKGLVQCAECDSAKVAKALMAPSISRKGGSQANDKERERVEGLRRVREHVAEHSEFVGDRFASEALKIHREEAEARGIHGSATSDEARELLDEGVEFYPLPVLPEDHN